MKTPSQIEIQAAWLENQSRDNLKFILAEYRFLVGRFVQWLGLTLGKSSDERIRQLLLHNLIEECGQIGGARSHLSLLDDCLASCGIIPVIDYKPLRSTICAEHWFFSTFSNQDCHTCLSVLGPGTECISQQFLKPLEIGIRQAFGCESVNYSYFDVHRAEVEIFHAQDINRAIELIEADCDLDEIKRLKRSRYYWSNEAISQHDVFWTSLRNVLHTEPSHLSPVAVTP